MERLVFDAEADGFVYDATTIWCISILNTETNEIQSYSDFDNDLEPISCGLERLTKAEEIIGHNIINYDIRLFNKLTGFTPTNKVLDTLILSKLLKPERPGGHSIEAWGERLGHKKPVHEDWSKYSKEMLHRCEEDTRINFQVLIQLENEFYRIEKQQVQGIQLWNNHSNKPLKQNQLLLRS